MFYRTFILFLIIIFITLFLDSSICLLPSLRSLFATLVVIVYITKSDFTSFSENPLIDINLSSVINLLSDLRKIADPIEIPI
jgi:hypothetical protein